MGRPKIYDAALRSRLLDEASTMLSSEGYRAVSLRTVTNRAGTSTNAVYTLFGSKEALMAEVILRDLDSVFTPIANSSGDSEPILDLLRLTREIRTFALRDPHMFNGAFEAMAEAREAGSLTDRINPEVRKIDQRLFNPILDLCKKVAEENPSKDLNATRMATAIWSAIHGYIVLETAGVVPVGDENSDEVFDELLYAVYSAWISTDLSPAHSLLPKEEA